MRIAICLPVYDHPKDQFVDCLIALLTGPDAQRHVFSRHKARGISIVSEAREAATLSAMTANPEALLLLDCDQTFPDEVATRLAAHDLPIVGANYRRKQPPNIPVSSATKLVGGTLIPITPVETGLEEVDAIGLGVCLIRAEVFRKLPRPWFGTGGGSEDAYFCRQAKAAGYSIHVDHAVKAGHVAETVLHF